MSNPILLLLLLAHACWACASRPECTEYDPDAPPPDWPGHIPGYEWAARGDLPADARCDLHLPLHAISPLDAMYGYERQDLAGGSKVIFVDTRPWEMCYWMGVFAQANRIEMRDGAEYTPDHFIVTHDHAEHLRLVTDGEERHLEFRDIRKMHTSAVSHNVPIASVDMDTGDKTPAPLWGEKVDALIRESGADRVVFLGMEAAKLSIPCYYEYCPMDALFPGVLSGRVLAFYAGGTDSFRDAGLPIEFNFSSDIEYAPTRPPWAEREGQPQVGEN